jgi:peroxiredoxin
MPVRAPVSSPLAPAQPSRRGSSRLGLLCLVAMLACKPEPATTNPEPTPDPATTTGPDAVTPDQADQPEPIDQATDPTEPADVEAPAETDDVDGPDEVAVAETGGSDGSPSEVEPSAAGVREPLPKPTHKLSGPKCQQSFSVGTKVKAFRLPSVDGEKTISPTGYRNRVVLLNFWGTWCKPCLEELPEFDRLYRKYRAHGLTLVAVATDEEPKLVQEFIDKHKLRARVALAGEEAAGVYNRPNFPFSFVIDGSGKIVAAYDFIDGACMGDLEQVIRDELEKLEP